MRLDRRLIFVRDVQTNHPFPRKLLSKSRAQSTQMFLLHDENDIGPAQMAGRNFDSRSGLSASRPRLKAI